MTVKKIIEKSQAMAILEEVMGGPYFLLILPGDSREFPVLSAQCSDKFLKTTIRL
jgi:hypothetical protein